MRIAVDARFLYDDEAPELRDFTQEVFVRLAAQHPAHQFIFLIDRKINGTGHLPANVIVVTITPKPSNFLLYKWWYEVRTPAVLKKQKADVFIATYGVASLNTSLPQIIVVRDLALDRRRSLQYSNALAYCKRYTKAFIKKANKIVTVSNFLKNDLITQYNVAGERVVVIGSGTDECFKPVDWEQREVIKDRIAGGSEYFVFASSSDIALNPLNVLKAFSIFKKWQKTNMKLIILGSADPAFSTVTEKLSSYKYRSDVAVMQALSTSERVDVVAAAYASIFLSSLEGFAGVVLEAMKCRVPVIASVANRSASEIAEDAALYADASNSDEIAQCMRVVFKDENLRTKLTEAASRRSNLFVWDKTASLLLKAIEEAVST